MATTDLSNEMQAPLSQDLMPITSSPEDDGHICNDLPGPAANGHPATPESEPNHTHVHKFFKGKENVGKALSERSGKLTLLELPVDILRLIVQEVLSSRTPMRERSTFAKHNSAPSLASPANPHIVSGYSYKRSRLPCLDELHSSQPRRSPNLLQVRHSMAGLTISSIGH